MRIQEIRFVLESNGFCENVFIVVVVLVFVFVSETRVSPVFGHRECYRAVSCNGFHCHSCARKARGLRSAHSEKHDLIYYEPYSRRRVMSCALDLFLLFERKVCPDKCTRHLSAVHRSCLDTLHDTCIFRIAPKVIG